MTQPAKPSPSAQWQGLYLAAATAPPSQAAAVAAAFRLADQVWRQVAADPGLDARTRAALTDPDQWATTALAAHRHLADTGAYAHLDLPAPQQCWANEKRVRTWLTARSDLPGNAHTTVAESWAIDEEFTWDADGIGTRMATLIGQAQQAQVFGVPGYTIGLRQVASDDPDDEATSAQHQITLTTPSGATLAAPPMVADHLADDGTSGVDAAVAVITNTAAVVTELLAAERHLIVTGITALTHRATTAETHRPSRGFAQLDLTASGTVEPIAIEAPSRPDRSVHR